jgi:hypothetical protein
VLLSEQIIPNAAALAVRFHTLTHTAWRNSLSSLF